jgi:hypothetical protein
MNLVNNGVGPGLDALLEKVLLPGVIMATAASDQQDTERFGRGRGAQCRGAVKQRDGKRRSSHERAEYKGMVHSQGMQTVFQTSHRATASRNPW